ncbi:MAG: hypothetical protein MUC69_04120, partial [Gemmatimonadales bacterium]|nr:hypothetical protein [Gemmatimonadales bacterium]
MRWRVGAALALAVAACSTLDEIADGVVAIELLPPTPSVIEVGDTALLRARALDANGDSVAADIVWVTPDTQALRIPEAATGLAIGTAPISAGRVQARLGSLAGGLSTIRVEARADTIVVVGSGLDSVAADVAESAPLVVRVESFAPAGPLGQREVVYEVTDPVFADTALRTVELSGGGLVDTVGTGSDGSPSPPVTLRRITGRTAPASATVAVRATQR